ncbi:hypothetical protein IPH25_01805 [bacterium]|nr:MAG: hypothetical protein IPG37_03935 [bacterium]QQR62160.1 MAG: hypothetical protein IPH25_01805 [bacterium]QQR63284.1 MAG: hypothetical protein IPH67_02305 [bacterium]
MIIPSAQLYIGTEKITEKRVCATLRSLFCPFNNCTSCVACIQIQNRQHSQIMWLTTTKGYVLDDLVPIREKSKFMLNQNERFFFIIEHAELLSIICSNALLKILEEPPAGYHFILLTHQPAALLSTIRSRCLPVCLQNEEVDIQFEFFFLHCTSKPQAITVILQECDRAKISEESAQALLYKIIGFWQEQKRAIHASHFSPNYINQILQILYEMLECLPNTGNTKLFLKTVLTQIELVRAACL